MRVDDKTGRRFHRLRVLQRTTGPHSTETYWQCRCDCDRLVIVTGRNLRSGNTKSCGCYATERRHTALLKHGRAHTVEWDTWQRAKGRCLNPDNPSYKHYGGRGIHICERWINDFPAFLADMGPRPKGHRYSLDRIDNSGNYEPTNCRWATPLQQARNTRSNRSVGTFPTITAIAESAGISNKTIHGRLKRGANQTEAIAPVGLNYVGRLFTFQGETHSIAEWSRRIGIHYDTLFARLCLYGWTVERALTQPAKRKSH